MARLATVDAGGVPHVVPVTFAVAGHVVWTAVDAKPKRGGELRRVRNVRENPRVCLLVDRYDEDWSALWWARADGVARLRDAAGRGAAAGLAALREKYPSTRAWSFRDR